MRGNHFALGKKHTDAMKLHKSLSMKGQQRSLGHKDTEETRYRKSISAVEGWKKRKEKCHVA